MSKVTPEQVLHSECINTGILDSLMMLCESDACFAFQLGQFTKGRENTRQVYKDTASMHYDSVAQILPKYISGV
jgi:hypothetical protein